MRKNRESEEYQDGNEASPDEMGNDPREVGSDSPVNRAMPSGFQLPKTRTTKASRSWTRPTKPLKLPGLRVSRMPPTIRSVPCTLT